MIQLKAIKLMKSLSFEDYCFTANLYFNGKKVAQLSGLGNGGGILFHYTPGFSPSMLEDELKSVLGVSELSESCESVLETYCNYLLTRHEEWKYFTKKMRESILYERNDALYALKKPASAVALSKKCDELAKGGCVVYHDVDESTFERYLDMAGAGELVSFKNYMVS